MSDTKTTEAAKAAAYRARLRGVEIQDLVDAGVPKREAIKMADHSERMREHLDRQLSREVDAMKAGTHQALRERAEQLRALAREVEGAAVDKLKTQLHDAVWSEWLETPDEIACALDRAAETGDAVEVLLERLPESSFAVPSSVRGVVRSAEPGSWWISGGGGGHRVQVSREPLGGHMVPTAVRCRVEVGAC